MVLGCEKFVPALAYLFCQNLPGSCLARFAYFLADLCIINMKLAYAYVSSVKLPHGFIYYLEGPNILSSGGVVIVVLHNALFILGLFDSRV